MSDLEGKLSNPTTSSSGLARQTLKQLRLRWGSVFDVRNGLSPVEVMVYGMSHERWTRLDGAKGEDSVYELQVMPEPK